MRQHFHCGELSKGLHSGRPRAQAVTWVSHRQQRLEAHRCRLQHHKQAREARCTVTSSLSFAYRVAELIVDSRVIQQAAAAAVAGVCIQAWQQRPRGWCRNDLLEVRESNVHSRGVFSVQQIEPGTVLGQYPGRLRTASSVLQKCATAPAASGYVFQLEGGLFLDPTDALGQPSSWPSPGVPWPLATIVTLAYINEPPVGAGGANVQVMDSNPQRPEDILLVVVRPLQPGQELFLDYGPRYDRSHYTQAKH